MHRIAICKGTRDKINSYNCTILQGGAGGDDFDDEWSDEEEEEVIDWID